MSNILLYGATEVDDTNSAYAPMKSLKQFQWNNRVFVVFTDKDNSRATRQENQLLSDREALGERDIVVLKLCGSSVKTIFGSAEGLEGDKIGEELDAHEAREFGASLLGKDGTVKLKVSKPISTGELFAIIDSMPMRAAEALKKDR
jgi:hypothetical protein